MQVPRYKVIELCANVYSKHHNPSYQYHKNNSIYSTGYTQCSKAKSKAQSPSPINPSSYLALLPPPPAPTEDAASCTTHKIYFLSGTTTTSCFFDRNRSNLTSSASSSFPDPSPSPSSRVPSPSRPPFNVGADPFAFAVSCPATRGFANDALNSVALVTNANIRAAKASACEG